MTYGGWLPAGILLVLTAVVGSTMVGLSALFGPRRPSADKSGTYECGMPLFQDAREPFSVKFYLVGVLFLLFDLETVFLIPWGVLGRGMGWSGFAAGAAFLAVLGAGLAYAWSRGVLDWDREEE